MISTPTWDIVGPGIDPGTPKDSALVITAERSARFLWSRRQYLHGGIKSAKGI